MTFTQLRNQVNTLMRKYATELEVYRATPLALELCDEMTDAVTHGRRNPRLTCNDWAWNLFKRLRDRGIRVSSHVGLYDYLTDCLEKLVLPQLNDVLRSLFPKARERGLIPRSREKIRFWPRRAWQPGRGYFAQTLAGAARASKPSPRPTVERHSVK